MQKIILLLPLLLIGCGKSQIAYQEEVQKQQICLDSVRSDVTEAKRAQLAHATELEILTDRVSRQEEDLIQLSYSISGQVRSSLNALEDKLALLEQKQAQAGLEMRRLAASAEEKGKALGQTRNELAALHQEVTEQLGKCKKALESVMDLVQAEPRTYRVRRGDSLAVIAKNHQTSVENLKELNGLGGDTIYPDQELVLPK